MIDVIIVNYMTADLTLRAAESVLASGSVEKCWVVDNSCNADEVEKIRRLEIDPRVQIVISHDNIGFAAAVNVAMAKSTGEQVLLLNPDATLSATTLDQLSKYLQNRARCAAVAPAIKSSASGVSVEAAGYLPTIRRVLCQYSQLYLLGTYCRFFRGVNIARNEMRRELDVEWVSGACMLVSREAIIKAGLLSERWFMYAEDMEWCERFLECGFHVRLLRWLSADHELSASALTSTRTSVMWVESQRDFYRLRSAASPLRGVVFDLVLASGLLLRGVVANLLRKVVRNPAKESYYEMQGRLFLGSAKAAIRPLSMRESL